MGEKVTAAVVAYHEFELEVELELELDEIWLMTLKLKGVAAGSGLDAVQIDADQMTVEILDPYLDQLKRELNAFRCNELDEKKK